MLTRHCNMYPNPYQLYIYLTLLKPYVHKNIIVKSYQLILPSGRAFGFASPTSCIKSKAKLTLWTFWSKSWGVRWKLYRGTKNPSSRPMSRVRYTPSWNWVSKSETSRFTLFRCLLTNVTSDWKLKQILIILCSV